MRDPCTNADGSRKRIYATKAQAKKAARKWERVYACDRHPELSGEAWHVGRARYAGARFTGTPDQDGPP